MKKSFLLGIINIYHVYIFFILYSLICHCTFEMFARYSTGNKLYCVYILKNEHFYAIEVDACIRSGTVSYGSYILEKFHAVCDFFQ